MLVHQPCASIGSYRSANSEAKKRMLYGNTTSDRAREKIELEKKRLELEKLKLNAKGDKK